MPTTIKTPCIGVCSTGLGDTVCRGCKRFTHEVIGWNGYSEDERRAIMARIEALVTQVVQERIVVLDQGQLQQQLDLNKVKVNPGANAYCLAYEAIRVFGSRLQDLSKIGCQPRAEWRALTIAELKKSIDTALFELSQAHFERYFMVDDWR